MSKLVGIVIISLIILTILKRINSSFALFISVCSSCLIFILIADDFSRIIELIKSIFSQVNNNTGFMNIMLKIVGISLIAQLVSDLCRDSGENTLANQTELATKIILLITVLPVFEAVIGIITGLLK